EKLPRVIDQKTVYLIAVFAPNFPNPVVEQRAVVWHLALFHVGMGPVRAGNHTVGKFFRQRLSKRQGLPPILRLAATRKTLGARHFRIAIRFVTKELHKK